MNNPLQMLSSSSLTMSSVDIAGLTGKEHKNVIADIRIQIFIGLYEFSKEQMAEKSAINKIQGITVILDNRGYWSEVHLDREHTLTLITGYDVKCRHAINKRWLELENQSAKPILDLRDQKQLSAIALQLIEINQEQAKQIEILEPKANALDRLRSAEGSIAISDAAKIVGIKRDEFFASLNRIKWIFKRNGVWLGYEKARAKGLVDHRPVEAHGKVRTQCVITPKGLSEIAVMLDMGDAV